MARWNLDSIPWDQFEPSLVDPQLLALARGACLVEFNADAYSDYLCRVFSDDPDLQARVHVWADEEKVHGLALKRWVELSDSTFDFERSLAKFCAAYQQVPDEGEESVRGSRARELVARCIVECGTTSFYAALRDASDEPVLRRICHNISQDEVLHFKLFRSALDRRYGPEENLGMLARLRVVLGRMMEASDEELTFAYRAGNFPDVPIDPSRLSEYSRDYMRRIAGLYRPEHFRLGLGLALKAAGINASQRVRTVLGHAAHRLLRFRFSDRGPQPQPH